MFIFIVHNTKQEKTDNRKRKQQMQTTTTGIEHRSKYSVQTTADIEDISKQ